MPLTTQSNYFQVGDGGKSRKSASSLFDPGQVGTVPQSPEFSGGNAAEHSEVVTDPGSTSPVPTFTAPTGPLGGSPASFTVIDVHVDAPVGEVASGDTEQNASGSDAGSSYPPTVTSATLPDVPGDRGKDRSSPIVGEP
jgi:hypothetical protein